MRIIGTLLIANRALNSLEIKWRITVRALFAPSAQARFIQSPDIVLVPISHHFLCNYRLPLHHIAFENFPHEVNWVGTFWSKL